MKKQARHKKKQSYKAVARVLVTLLILITGLIAYYSIRGGDRTLLMVFHSEKQVADTSGAWNLILVDRDHYIPANYQVEMFDDARAAGLALFVREGYRTTKEQQQIMDDRIKEYENQGCSKKEAKKKAEEYVAIPGTSEHQLGLSVDINADTSKCSSDAVYQWLDENAYKYGFVKRYPEDKTDITSINNEPWHYRYVGKDAARTMKQENLCLEEYLIKYK